MKSIEEIYLSINNALLNDEKPSERINELSKKEIFKTMPFSMLYDLKKVEQSPIYHPEGNVWNHVMLVIDEAAKVREKSKDRRALMWAALLHDIGKPPTTKVRKGRITSYNHDKEGENMAFNFLSYFTENEEFKIKVSKLVRYHMHILYVLKDLPFKDMDGMKRDVDIEELALLGLSDRLGRLGKNEEEEKENIKLFINTFNLSE